MKKNALTVLEILIAMSLMVVASYISISTLKVYINKDTDIVKFKHAFGSLSEVIYDLKNDTCAYPMTNSFQDTVIHPGCDNMNDSYTASNKFKKLFTSKFNVLKNNIDITLDSAIPIIKYMDSSNTEYYETNTKIKCFIENKGFMFCPPEINLTSPNKLKAIYIPVYVNKIDTDNSKTTDIEKAMIVEVDYSGKIEIPAIVGSVIDCTNKAYNNYNHCKALDKMMSTEF